MSSIEINVIKEYLLSHFDGLCPKNSWGETSFFYNPGNSRPSGSYFFTIKEKDGENDKACNLNRQGIYRINFGITEASFLKLFGKKPKRPKQGGIIEGNYDFCQKNTLLPHPVYGWMKWVMIINPSNLQFEKIKPLIEKSYQLAKKRFHK